MVWHVSCQIGRGGSPSNTLGTHGTETGSPELLVAWRGACAQGPMGQERRWAEVIETFQAKVVVDMRVAGVHTCEY